MLLNACSSNPSVQFDTMDADSEALCPIEAASDVQGCLTKNAQNKVHNYYKIGHPYKIKGKWYYPAEKKDYKEIGYASWYGKDFHGGLTANGEIYDMNSITAAHRTLPLPSYVRVTNLKNGYSIVVRVNDRGPYSKGRILDLSKRAAELLGFKKHGLAKIQAEYVKPAPLKGNDEKYLRSSFKKLSAAELSAIFREAKTKNTKSIADKKELPQQGPVIFKKPHHVK